MRILLVTPLYPPDIKEPAPYVKELATRMRHSAEVTILTYGHIPEAINGVRIFSVEKSAPLPLRLIHFTRALIRTMRDVDVVYVENGPSVELPFLIATFFHRPRLVLHMHDIVPLEHGKRNTVLALLTRVICSRVDSVACHKDTAPYAPSTSRTLVHPNGRPEILPFKDKDERAFTSYEDSWRVHMDELSTLFHHE
jgi:UDP-N-acetylglucosamine:LPS N-acetylglucosamine transferase